MHLSLSSEKIARCASVAEFPPSLCSEIVEENVEVETNSSSTSIPTQEQRINNGNGIGNGNSTSTNSSNETSERDEEQVRKSVQELILAFGGSSSNSSTKLERSPIQISDKNLNATKKNLEPIVENCSEETYCSKLEVKF